MADGVHQRARKDAPPKWYWSYGREKSGDFATKTEAADSYIQRLHSTPYAPLLHGKTPEQQRRIVLGYDA